MSSNPYQPPGTESAVRQNKPVRNLGGLTLALSLAFSMVTLSLFTTGLTSSILVARQANGGLEDVEADPLWIVLGLSAVVYGLGALIGFVLFCIWIYRAKINADALVAGPVEFTPGWAVGWFFVPIANLFKPYQAVAEMHRASDPNANPDFLSSTPVPLYLPLWWGTWIAFNVLTNFNRPLLQDTVGARSPNPTGALLEGIVGAISAALLVVLVRRIYKMQLVKAKAVAIASPAGVPVPSTGNRFL